MQNRILAELSVALELTGTRLSNTAIEVFEAELRAYPDEAAIIRALQRCRRECHHRLTLADVLKRATEGLF